MPRCRCGWLHFYQTRCPSAWLWHKAPANAVNFTVPITGRYYFLYAGDELGIYRMDYQPERKPL